MCPRQSGTAATAHVADISRRDTTKRARSGRCDHHITGGERERSGFLWVFFDFFISFLAEIRRYSQWLCYASLFVSRVCAPFQTMQASG